MDSGKQRGPVITRATTNTYTEPDDTASEDWRARLADEHAEWRRRRDAEKALRAEQAARRAAGKRILHGRRRRGGR